MTEIDLGGIKMQEVSGYHRDDLKPFPEAEIENNMLNFCQVTLTISVKHTITADL